jgi:retron-type reverse transcriptase
MIHEMHRKKQSGVILKLDFKKAYDKINWSFVQQTLCMKDLSSTWRKWIASFIKGGHVGIKVNDQVGKNFQTRKGVRQGDPLSPILFNIVIDMLAILINRAKNGGQISGVIPNIINDGLSILQYADNTILFMDIILNKQQT